MSDPISGDSIRQVSKTGDEVKQAQEKAKTPPKTEFDAVMDGNRAQDKQVKQILQSDLRTGVDRMPHTVKVRLERELETRVLKMDRGDQVEYFATKAEANEKVLAQLRQNSPDLPASEWKEKLMETCDWLSAEGDKTKQFLKDFQAGKDFSPKELLVIQLRSHHTGEISKILTKSVEMGVSGLKTIFQTNV